MNYIFAQTASGHWHSSNLLEKKLLQELESSLTIRSDSPGRGPPTWHTWLIWFTPWCYLDDCSVPSAAGVGYLVILTHQRAESHHGEKSLQENAKGVHQGPILAPPGVRTPRRAGGRRRVGRGHSGQLCSPWTCQSCVSEVGEHAASTNSVHDKEELGRTN